MSEVASFLRTVAEDDNQRVRGLLSADPPLSRARGPHPYWGGTPNGLEVAVEWGNREAVGILLDGGADLNEVSESYGGWSPLHLAIHRGRMRGTLDIAQYLIERGAKVDAIAAAGLGMTDYLRTADDFRGLGPGGATPLHWTATIEVAECLLARGADPNARDARGNPPERKVAGHAPEVAQFLLKTRGAQADIHLAAAMGDVARVAEILDADPEGRSRQTYAWDSVANFSGGMPLHIAAIHGRIDVAAHLLARGADVNAHCLEGVTPLHYTAIKGQVKMAKFLLDHGADPGAHDPKHQSTPLGWARFQRWPKLVELLSGYQPA